MDCVIITGALGLVGSAVSKYLSKEGFKIYGIDNDFRSHFFEDIAPLDNLGRERCADKLGMESCFSIDISDRSSLDQLFEMLSSNNNIVGIVHCAAQPSHDWAARDPFLDFDINASGTLNICECLRKHCCDALLIHLSTNKVYGDTPNRLPLIELDLRYELSDDHPYYNGIDEQMSVDHSKHSLFGCSKLAADIYVQEYSRYFGIKTVVLRGGCLTGEAHRGAKLHGFMNYLIKCAVTKMPYEVFGYNGKQVRDNLHAHDIAELISRIIRRKDSRAIVYPLVANLGGGRANAVSILELIHLLRSDFGLTLEHSFTAEAREGDHQWYITDNSFLHRIYNWKPSISVRNIVESTISSM